MPAIISDYLKNELNECARQIYAQMGYNVKEGFDFSASQHPQELMCYAIAEQMYDYWWEKFQDEQ